MHYAAALLGAKLPEKKGKAKHLQQRRTPGLAYINGRTMVSPSNIAREGSHHPQRHCPRLLLECSLNSCSGWHSLLLHPLKDNKEAIVRLQIHIWLGFFSTCTPFPNLSKQSKLEQASKHNMAPQLPTSQPSERRPSHKWTWLSLLGLILLCGAAIHRRQLPIQRSKDLSGYRFIYLSPAAESLDQLPHLNNDEDDDDIEEILIDNEFEEAVAILDDEEDVIELETLRQRRRRRVQALIGRAQFQEWEH